MGMDVVYHPFLVCLSIAVAIFASYVALNLAHSVTQAKGRSQLAWLACGSLAMGVGIWSMHFIGMLAFEIPGMEMAYDIPLMALSVVIAVIGSTLALYVVSRPVVPPGSLISSGIAMAAAISGMHYLGMYSMRMSARIEWNIYLLILSIIIALVASFGALTIAYRLRNRPDRQFALVLASVIMGIAIAGMHYTGMFAANFIQDDEVAITAEHLLVTSQLTFTTLMTTLFVLGIALATSVVQRMWVFRQKQSSDILKTSEEKYRLLVGAVKDYAIFILNPEGIITTWNAGAEKITGYSEREVIGRHMSTFYTQEDIDADVTAAELKIASEKGHFEGEAIRVRKDGTKFWANIVIDPLVNREGQITSFSKVLRDISLLKESEARTRTLNEELEKRVQQRTLELQASESQLRMITNAIPVLVAQVDRQEKFLFANDSFCDWFLTTQKNIRELHFRDVLGEERYPANKVFIDRALAGETVSYERESHSGARRADLNITFVPELDETGNVIGFIIVAMDVSNYKRIEADLIAAKEQAEVANETKSAFLANMSHEIRTPLGAVLGFSELLLDDEMSRSEKVNSIEIIKRNGKLLSTIINDILDLSKVEAGKLQIEKSNVDLRQLLNETITLLNLEAEGKGIELIISSEGVVPSTISTDPTRLRQILFNIVGNAIKFTEKGSVSLKIRLNPTDLSKLLFIVQDTGIGISAEHASRLFAPFSQGDATTTRRFGGTGLGLVLSKKLAAALGGDVWLADSNVGKGSTFCASIDHGQSQEVFFKTQTETPSANVLRFDSHPHDRTLSRMKVLVVDDSADNLSLITKILRIAGAQVETAGSGRQGIERALKGDVSVVLMDLQMPEMDGYEATKELRARGFNRPIIALTAHAMKEERQRCLDNGFNDHMTKPIDRDFLLQVLAEYRG